MSDAYKKAGVDVETKEKVLGEILKNLKMRPSELGQSFAGSSVIGSQLVFATVDGVGSKTIFARMARSHEVIGQDIVAHCANDLAVHNATPLFFLDYIGMHTLNPKILEQALTGMDSMCAKLNCRLISGETAQMPRVYQRGKYEIVGTMIGARQGAIANPLDQPCENDVLLGIGSSGLHTNGYHLALTTLFEPRRGETRRNLLLNLLEPHLCYAPLLLDLFKNRLIKAAAHITGGGIPGNLPRVLPPTTTALIRKGSWPVLDIFKKIQRYGKISEDEMYRTFNMGIGMIVITDRKLLSVVKARIKQDYGLECYKMGTLVTGEPKVIFFTNQQ